jgi:hypothetical protein
MAGQEEYRLLRQIMRNQYATTGHYVAKLHTREGEKGIHVKNEGNTYETINGE